MGREFNPQSEPFEQFTEPYGRESVSVGFAHLSLTFQMVNDALKKLIRQMYDQFILDVLPSDGKLPHSRSEDTLLENTSSQAKITTVRAKREYFLKKVPGEVYRIEFFDKEGVLFFWSYSFACRYIPEKNEGVLALCIGEKINQRQDIENFMRTIFAYIALQHGSFFLHSSGIVKDKKAHIFFGHSGAGKTTVARFSKDFPLLSDDQVLIYLKDGKPYASGVPFCGGERFRREQEALQLKNINEGFEVAGFYWLVKDTKTFLEPLSQVQSTVKLASAIPFIKDSPFPMQKALDLASEVSKHAKVYNLHFRKDDSFLAAI